MYELPHCRMGILMESSEVNVRIGNFRGAQLFGAMGTPGDAFYSDAVHAIAFNTREPEFGKVAEPIPITIKAYQHYQGHAIHGYGFPTTQQMIALTSPGIPEVEKPSTSSFTQMSPVKEEMKDIQTVRPPPKKKWIKEYLEEEPKSPVSVRVVTGLSVTARSNGLVRTSPVPAAPPPAPAPAPALVFEQAPAPAPAPTAPPPAPLLDFVQEHSRPRTTSTSHGTPQIPSPPSVGSNGSSSGSGSGSAPRAGTREVHNKLEKNRRAHLKECFELLKRQLPATPDDKKTSNLSILASAIRYIQVLRRKERECEHEMERLAREKIAAQQRVAALKRDVSVRATATRPRSTEGEEMERDDRVNGQILGIPLSITSSPPRVARIKSSPPRSLNLSTKLRTLPIQITPTTSQVVRTSYAARHSTLTLTTLAPAEHTQQNGQLENGVTNTLGTLVHPAQIHLPISQVVGGGGLVVGGAALQLLSAGGGLRVLQPALHANGISSGDSNIRITRENGIVSPPPASSEGVVVSGLAPLVVSQAGHLLTHSLAHKMVETQVVKGSVVSAQYLSAATLKPVVVLPPPDPPT